MSGKNIFLVFSFSIAFISCDFKNSHDENTISNIEVLEHSQVLKVSPTNETLGTWVSNRASHFQIVEIMDSSKANIYRFQKWQPSDLKIKEKLAYFKSDGKLSITYGSNFCIETSRFKFYFLLVNDTLFEMAEPGRVDTLVKVYSDSVLEKR